MGDVVLQTTGLVKEFKGFRAVDGVDLSVRRGHIHALIGPNGAGKTTCFNLLTRFLPATRGRIEFNGRDITRMNTAAVARIGMVRSFQISSIFPQLSVLDNVRVALQREQGWSMHFWRSERCLRDLDADAMRLLSEVDLAACADLRAQQLPYGQRRALELATTLAMDPQLMLLDEPTQGMGREDVGRVTALIRRVAQGRTVLMVEHNMSVVSSIADRITVLARGSVLAEGDYAAVSANPLVREAYMGRAEPAQGNTHV
ncbi:MAG: ABC transporter ATP-binding protein [Comamonadaceae bacterium]|nr:MAG: ABC transporter ATP-binding protein [Comamonadaceae bacterium]